MTSTTDPRGILHTTAYDSRGRATDQLRQHGDPERPYGDLYNLDNTVQQVESLRYFAGTGDTNGNGKSYKTFLYTRRTLRAKRYRGPGGDGAGNRILDLQHRPNAEHARRLQRRVLDRHCAHVGHYLEQSFRGPAHATGWRRRLPSPTRIAIARSRKPLTTTPAMSTRGQRVGARPTTHTDNILSQVTTRLQWSQATHCADGLATPRRRFLPPTAGPNPPIAGGTNRCRRPGRLIRRKRQRHERPYHPVDYIDNLVFIANTTDGGQTYTYPVSVPQLAGSTVPACTVDLSGLLSATGLPLAPGEGTFGNFNGFSASGSAVVTVNPLGEISVSGRRRRRPDDRHRRLQTERHPRRHHRDAGPKRPPAAGFDRRGGRDRPDGRHQPGLAAGLQHDQELRRRRRPRPANLRCG